MLPADASHDHVVGLTGAWYRAAGARARMRRARYDDPGGPNGGATGRVWRHGMTPQTGGGGDRAGLAPRG
jgi:hypothetical protein